jgi:hypothetical protein
MEFEDSFLDVYGLDCGSNQCDTLGKKISLL